MRKAIATRSAFAKIPRNLMKIKVEPFDFIKVKNDAVEPIDFIKIKNEADEKELDDYGKKRIQYKLKQLASYGTSPFQDFRHPTPEECSYVVISLAKIHGLPKRNLSKSTNAMGQACGEVPNVLDALVRTILSQNTSNQNSSRAKESLDHEFGVSNWDSIANAPLERVFKSLECGGLANVKAARIQKILRQVKAEFGIYSLDHLNDPSLTDKQVLEKLMSYDGIGPKTAACVLMFCLCRETFAVDTHVYRLSKSLGWVPKIASREQTFQHLDVCVPRELKYPLHVLLIKHGKSCALCAASFKHSLTPKDECPLREFKK